MSHIVGAITFKYALANPYQDVLLTVIVGEKLNDAKTKEPDYGNWVSLRIIYLPGGLGLVALLLSLIVPLLLIPAIVFILIAAYFAYAHHLFSPCGKDIQRRTRQMVVDSIEWDGKGRALDIGCGNGAITIMLAKKFPDAQVTGIDCWGKEWDHSKAACERNATIEGVIDRVTFQRASASSLPFDDGSYDIVISNLTFHEVKDTKDKRTVIREALRVLKDGGRFSFQDLFLFKYVYGDLNELLVMISDCGISEVEFVETRDSDFIPSVLRLPFMLGTMGMIVGKK